MREGSGLRPHGGAPAAWLTTALLLGLIGRPAAAAIDCWIDAETPKVADGLSLADPRVAPMRQALQQLNALLHKQPELHDLPRTRLRSSWQVGGQWAEPARAGSFLLRDHREKVWTPGRCDVIAGADRLGPWASIVATINAPEAFFATTAPEIDDEQLRAWRELPQTGTIQGRPLYAGHMLVVTRNGRLPWVPVTTAEYVDFTLRDLRRKLKEVEESRARNALPPAGSADREAADEAQVQKVAEGMRKIDPKAADKMVVELRAQLAANRAAEQAAEARRRARPGIDDEWHATMIARVEAWRASLSPAQLAAQARLGINGMQQPEPGTLERYPLLAKPDPAFPWDAKQPARPQMIKISVMGGEVFEQPMQRVLQTLDLRALQGLVQW
ncbi:hypothetical protein [Roseateles violae]|uniref:Uncharacterized protein n=1 Tax=Roseateles violae TaxID=3058042 RepID=A0ABT8DYK7_9BURK|nr:hypothetical protein [Pelomonas sp. PFR6]MDN3922665.1 hypothetical protein [Pelomonas sp. PFR6]